MPPRSGAVPEYPSVILGIKHPLSIALHDSLILKIISDRVDFTFMNGLGNGTFIKMDSSTSTPCNSYFVEADNWLNVLNSFQVSSASSRLFKVSRAEILIEY